jgi:hypothetical protein
MHERDAGGHCCCSRELARPQALAEYRDISWDDGHTYEKVKVTVCQFKS